MEREALSDIIEMTPVKNVRNISLKCSYLFHDTIRYLVSIHLFTCFYIYRILTFFSIILFALWSQDGCYTFKHHIYIPGRKEYQRLSPPKDLCFGLGQKALSKRFFPYILLAGTGHFPNPDQSLAKGNGC